MNDVLERLAFYRQFRRNFETTGAITPSSRFLANAVTRPLRRRNGPARILEAGPGTGVVTKRILELMRPGDQLDIVELNPEFAAILQQRFEQEPLFRERAAQCRLHVCALQEFQTEQPYDFLISGLPLNNFSPALVAEIFEVFFRLMAPGGVLSYFEYMGVRQIKKLVSNRHEKNRLKELDKVAGRYLARHRFRRDWVFANVLPAWVQHLQQAERPAAHGVRLRMR